MNRQAGATFAELMIALLILTGVMSSLLMVQRTTSSSLASTSTSGQLQDKAMQTLEVVASELRWADMASLLITTENGSARLDLQVPAGFSGGTTVWSSTITYRIEPSPIDSDHNGSLDEGRLVRVQNGASRSLCDHVLPGGFTVTPAGSNLQLRLRLARRDTSKSRLSTVDAKTSITVRN